MIRPTILFSLLVLSCLALAAPLQADEDVKEDSAAAKLFREAWWAETGRGALDQAAQGYERAAAAKGSDAVRARAVYRMAVVLHRMGKTQDAVRALETLATKFPGQSDLLARAKERLDEWTAEDLRTSFSEWYKRYQYSPEFQAKIVDLVLALGSNDQKVSRAARQELLTIGEPAVPALSEHTRSPNRSLRDAAIALLVQIGTLPEPDVLWDARAWEREDALWRLLEASEDPVRSTYARAAASSDDYRAGWIAALLKGRDAVLDAVSKETNNTTWMARALLAPLLSREQPPAFWERLRRMTLDPGVHWNVRRWIAEHLIQRWYGERRHGQPDPTGLTTEELLAWFDRKWLRPVVQPFMRQGALPSVDAWKPAAEAVLERAPRAREQKDLLAALSGQLRVAPADADLELAVEAFVHVLSGLGLNQLDTWPLVGDEGRFGDGERPRSALAAAIRSAEGPMVRGAPRIWWQKLRGSPGVWEALLDWTVTAVDPDVRSEAMKIVAYEIRDGIARMTRALEAPSRRRELHDALFNNLRNNPALTSLDWDAESLTRLAETAWAWDRYGADGRRMVRAFVGGPRVSRRYTVNSPFATTAAQTLGLLLLDDEIRALFFEAALKTPERFPHDIWKLLPPSWHERELNRTELLARLRKHELSWTTPQRRAGLRLFVTSDLFGRGFEELTAWLRVLLASGRVHPDDRFHVIDYMPKLTLADLLGLYDFTVPAQVDQATASLDRLPREADVYDAFLPALRPDGPQAARVVAHFRPGPESRIHDLVRRVLEHEQARVYNAAEAILRKRDRAEDLPLWVDMLGHRDAWIRASAAKALGRLYDEDAIKALAKAVDDPDPNVRDAVLQALERIEKTEKQKERWREYAKGK